MAKFNFLFRQWRIRQGGPRGSGKGTMQSTAAAISQYRPCSPSLVHAIESGAKPPAADFVIAAGNVMVLSEPDKTPDINTLLASADLPQIDPRLFPKG
jgi:hypothetical protein